MATTESSNQESPESSSELDLIGIFHAFLSRIWILVGCLAATSAIGLLYCLLTPKTYEATTVIQVEQAERKIVNVQDVATDDLRATEQLKTIEQNVAADTILQAVIQSLSLRPDDLGLKINDGQAPSESSMIRALRAATSAKLQRGTRLINVTVENTSPEMAQKLTGEIVQQFTRAYIDQRIGINDAAYGFLIAERDRLEREIEKSTQAVQAFKEANPDLPLDDSQNLMESRLLALNTTVNESRKARFMLEADYSQVQQLGTANPDGLLAIASVASAPSVLAMQKDLTGAESEFAAITERYKPKHPKFAQAQSKVDELRNAFRQTIVKAAESVGTALKAASESEEKAIALLREQEKAKLEFGKVSMPYASLTKNLENDQELYNNVQRRLKETELTRSMDQGSVRVVQPAFLPDRPSKPKTVLVFAAAVFVGVMAGGLIIFALNVIDQSYKTVDQVEDDLGLPAVGSIPKATKADIEMKAELTLKDPNGLIAEAFRSMRASLNLLGGDKGAKTTLFTSAVPGEGKSFCSVNYAVSLAQLGEKTLLIDCDLRLPNVHTHFFETMPGTGLGNILLGKATLDEAVTKAVIENLDVLSSGMRIQKPAELISRGDVSELLKHAAGRYDRVIIDSAPIHAVSDSLMLLKDVEVVCLVVKAGKTPRRAVARALQKIVEAKGNVAGVVLNQLPKSAMNYYYYYSAGKYGDAVYGSAGTDA